MTSTSTGPNFGDLGFYSGSFVLPKGSYAMEFLVKMHSGTKQDGTPAGKPRLGILITAHPLDGGEKMEQFLSMGSKADLSFAPAPDGKSLAEVPGAPASTAPRNTNWNLFLKSLYDCGLPKGVFQTNIKPLDGIHVRTDLVPEPEERKGYGQATTGEAADEKRQGSGMIPVVVEILEKGKPWEGTGGLPSASGGSKPAAHVSPATAAPSAPQSSASDDDIKTAAINAVSTILEKEPEGTTKLKLRTGTFKAAGANAQKVMDTFFVSDDALNGLLGELGYKVNGSKVEVL